MAGIGDRDTFDYVVVGGGAAGCVVAARLAEMAGVTVALIEAGPMDTNPWIHIPLGFGRVVPDPKMNWGYETEPEPELNGRRVSWPRGKVLGGSGSINGLVFLRGAAGDFDDWQQLGARGWAYRDVLPYFKKLANQTRGADDYHDTGGPVWISDVKISPGAKAWIEAVKSLGVPGNPDFNGRSIEGVGPVQLNVHNGRRSTTAKEHLKPALRRGNIALVTGTQGRRVLLAGRRAVAVEVNGPDGIKTIRARREIILSGGSINSPQLLLNSGIGPAAELQEVGVPVAHDLKGVGKNLQDHFLVRMSYKSRSPTTLNDIMKNPLKMAKMGLEYAILRSGPMTIGATEATAFVRVDKEVREPELQFQYANFSWDNMQAGLHKHSGFMWNFCVCRPASRGEIKLASAHPQAKPKIFANYITAESDKRLMLEAFRMSRRIAKSPAMAAIIAEEHQPGPACETDAEFIAYMREVGGTVYHPSGTCRMGEDDRAVVDSELRVRGLDGLAVVDASVMPQVPSPNIHAATIMIAEKASDHIKARAKG